MAQKHIYGQSRPANLPPALQSLCMQEMRLPWPYRNRIAALVALLIPQARDLAEVLTQLPGEAALSLLTHPHPQGEDRDYCIGNVEDAFTLSPKGEHLPMPFASFATFRLKAALAVIPL